MSAQPTKEEVLNLVNGLLDRDDLEPVMVTGNAGIRDITPDGAKAYEYDCPAVTITILLTKKVTS